MAKLVETKLEELFVSGSLNSLLPLDSECRIIYKYLKRLDFRKILNRYKNDKTGRPCYDPVRLMGIWMRGLMRNISSAPELARLCRTDIEFRWLCGDNPPEKSILSDFRIRNREDILELTSQIRFGLEEKGLKPGKGIVTDGTIINAAGSKHKIRDKQKLMQKIAGIRKEIDELLNKEEKNEPERDRSRELEQEVKEIEELLSYCEVKGLEKICKTEPTAHVMKRKDGSYGPGYNVQWNIDDETGTILNYEIIEQGNDQGRLLLNTENTLESYPEIQRVSGDSAYHKGEDLSKLHEKGINTAVPNDSQENRRTPGIDENYFADKFVRVENGYICPEGHLLNKRIKKDKTTYKYYGAPCHSCNKRDQCMSNKDAKLGRSICESIYLKDIELTKTQTTSKLGKMQLKARSIFAEGVSMRLKRFLGITRLKTFGLSHVRSELNLYSMIMEFFVWCGIWQPLCKIDYAMA